MYLIVSQSVSQHCGPFTAAQVVLDLSDLPTFGPSLSSSPPYLANDEAHALHHGYTCSERTSASLRPKFILCQPNGDCTLLVPMD